VAAEVHASLAVVSACSQLASASKCKDAASPEGLATLCPDGKQGIFVGTALKVCALCAAGERGAGGARAARGSQRGMVVQKNKQGEGVPAVRLRWHAARQGHLLLRISFCAHS
jgi:hypothetical protein